METNKNSKIERVSQEVITYVNLRLDALKLQLVEGLSVFFSKILSILIFGLLCLVAVFFLSWALVYWLAEVLGSLALACLITGGFFLLVAIIVFLLRGRLFAGSMVSMFAQMFFNQNKEQYESED